MRAWWNSATSTPASRCGTKKPGADVLRAECVDQQPHLHAGLGALDEQRGECGADRVGLVDAVLEVHMVARCAHGFEDRIEGGRTAHQQPGAGRTGHRHAAGCHAGCSELAQGGWGRSRGFARRVGGGRRACAGTAAQAPDALLLQTLRTEKLVDHEAEHRQQRQRKDLAHRRHRCALLQHDPNQEGHEIKRTAEREQGGPRNVCNVVRQGGPVRCRDRRRIPTRRGETM